jgi:hypothetical protein
MLSYEDPYIKMTRSVKHSSIRNPYAKTPKCATTQIAVRNPYLKTPQFGTTQTLRNHKNISVQKPQQLFQSTNMPVVV